MSALPAADYFGEAQSWDADRQRQNERSVRAAWWVAAAGWSCAVRRISTSAAPSPLVRHTRSATTIPASVITAYIASPQRTAAFASTPADVRIEVMAPV